MEHTLLMRHDDFLECSFDAPCNAQTTSPEVLLQESKWHGMDISDPEIASGNVLADITKASRSRCYKHAFLVKGTLMFCVCCMTTGKRLIIARYVAFPTKTVLFWSMLPRQVAIARNACQCLVPTSNVVVQVQAQFEDILTTLIRPNALHSYPQ